MIDSETRARHASVERLLEHLIDYAGLFPPAQHEMSEVVRRYADALTGPRAWMLERIIIPVARLDEFESAACDLLPRREEDEPWPISALTRPAGDPELPADLERIEAFNLQHSDPAQGAAIIDVIELKAGDSGAVDAALDVMPDEVFPFFEIPVADDPRGLITTMVGGDAGAKIRTGGVTADLYPAPEHVARFIALCASADVPFKATAGLHHPLRHYSDVVATDEFGFLNIFVAGVLATSLDIDEATLCQVLVAQSIDEFVIEDDCLGWREHRAMLDDVEDARLAFAVSYGSCSFDEPCDDLITLGLLEDASPEPSSP